MKTPVVDTLEGFGRVRGMECTDRGRRWLALVLCLFVIGGTVRYWNTRGDDLASSYLGCRVLAAGEPGSLYTYDADDFSKIPENADWARQAKAGGYDSYFHPYVQTPLWAWSLEPLCEHLRFPWFNRVFVIVALVSLAGIVVLVAFAWAPVFLEPLTMGILLAGLWFSQPFGYAMFLTQTHALYMLLVVAAVVLAERRWEGAAGFLVAMAAAVKLTPAVLAVYWLVTRRWKAVASLVGWSAVLMGLTWAVLGSQLVKEYFANLHRVSGVLLLAENNQSFAAWVSGRFYPLEEIWDFNPLPLPAWLKLLSYGLLAASAAAGGLIDRGRWRNGRGMPRLGMGIALIGATIFAPIAWTHYFIVLLVPVMLLVQEARNLKGAVGVALLVLTGIAAGLNYMPFAADVWNFDLGRWAVLRGQFFASVLCMVGLGAAAWWEAKREPVLKTSSAMGEAKRA